MKVIPIALALALYSAGAAIAATTSIDPGLCAQWNLSAADLSVCNARWATAVTDADRDAIARKYNPNYTPASSGGAPQASGIGSATATANSGTNHTGGGVPSAPGVGR